MPDGIRQRRIAITGATGLIGTALHRAFAIAGHEVVTISRNPGPSGVRWNPARREIDAAAIAGVDVVVHLAGESIAGSRWTAGRKADLRESRVPATRWFTEVLAHLVPVPRVLISASAVGIYGNRGDEVLTEASPLGDDFLAALSRDWEAAADPARQAGIRVVHPRFGIVLAPAGGVLAKMTPPFRLGLGGPAGGGQQWVSWITIDDLSGGVEHLLGSETVAGPVNFTSPHPVRNDAFAQALGRALHRPAMIPLPAFALRLAFGELADATLLASQRAVPARLTESGYRLRYPDIDEALRHVLTTPLPPGA
jgi:uncharacterized protein (TIGR01777 family)